MKNKFKVSQHTRIMWESSGYVSGPRRTTSDFFTALVEAPSLEKAVAKLRAYFPADTVLHHVQAYRKSVVILIDQANKLAF